MTGALNRTEHCYQNMAEQLLNIDNLKQEDLSYCTCSSCPINWREERFAELIETIHANPDFSPSRPLKITSIGSGKLGMEKALVIALHALGFKRIHLDLVDPIYKSNQAAQKALHSLISSFEGLNANHTDKKVTVASFFHSHELLKERISTYSNRTTTKIKEANEVILTFGFSTFFIKDEKQFSPSTQRVCDYQLLKDHARCVNKEAGYHTKVFEACAGSDFHDQDLRSYNF